MRSVYEEVDQLLQRYAYRRNSIAVNRNTRSSRKEHQESKHPKINKSDKKKGKLIAIRAKQSSAKLINTGARKVRQVNDLNSLKTQKSKVPKGKSLSVKASERLKEEVVSGKVEGSIKTRKTPRISSKMHNDQSERSRRSASQCCADCKSVVRKREQLRLRASLGIKLCDSCWNKRNVKTPNRPPKSVVTKSCEIKLVDILRTPDSSLDTQADTETTTPVKRKRGPIPQSDKGNKKFKLRNGGDFEESEEEKLETDLKTENQNESDVILQADGKELEESEANKQPANSESQAAVADPLCADDLNQETKCDPDDSSAADSADDKEMHTPEAKTKVVKKSPGKVTSKAKALVPANSGEGESTTNSRASRGNSKLIKTTNNNRGKAAKSNLRKTQFKRVNNKQLSGNISKLKTRTSSNKNTGKTVKVPFKKKVFSKRLSNNEIIEALDSVGEVEISKSLSSKRQNRKTLKGNKVPLQSKSPIKRHEKSSQSYAVTKVKQIAANNKRKSGRKERHSGSSFFCAVCNKDFDSYSETKLHEISHDGRYPVLILHRCDSAQGVLSLIREVDFPSYDPDPPVILENGEPIKSDELKEEPSVDSKPPEKSSAESSPSKSNVRAANEETKAKDDLCSDTSKESTEGKKDEVNDMLGEMFDKRDDLVDRLEEMFGSCNEDSGSSIQAKDVGGDVKGVTDSTALVEVLDESFKDKIPEINNALNSKLEENNHKDTKAQDVSVGDDDEPKLNNDGNQISLESEIETAQRQGCLSGRSPETIDEHKLSDIPEADKKSSQLLKDVLDSTEESHDADELSDLKCEDKQPVPEDLEELPLEKCEVKNDTRDDQSGDDILSGGSMVKPDNCEVSENDELSKNVQKDDLDKMVQLEKEAAEGATHIHMETEDETSFSANALDVEESEKEAESKTQDQDSNISDERNESNRGEALLTENGKDEVKTASSDENHAAEIPVTVNSGEEQSQNSKESADPVPPTQPDSSSPSPTKTIENKVHKDISHEVEQSEISSDDKIDCAKENNMPEDVDTELSGGLQKAAEISENSECRGLKFDAIEEPGILENSNRSSNRENLSDLLACESDGAAATEDVSEASNVVPAAENSSDVQAASKCDEIDILIKEVLESSSLECDKSNSEDVSGLLTDGGVSNNNGGCVQNDTPGHLVCNENSSGVKTDAAKVESVPLDDELNLEPVSDDEVDFI